MTDMSTANTFTMRDVSRETARVFAAVKKFGRVVVKSRSGDAFTIVKNETAKPDREPAESPADSFFRRADERAKRFREMGYIPPPKSEMERINRVIAGEE